jgi:acylphosphatase
MKKLIRTTIIVYGDVQKGDYRGRVVKIAKMMDVDNNGIGNITGTVQNLENEHTVKIVAEGDGRDIDWFYDKIKIRESLINVIRGIRDKNKDIEIDKNQRAYESFYKIVDEGETDERLDKVAELLKDLTEVMGNGFKHLNGEMEKGFKEQRAIIVWFSTDMIHVRLLDGREISVPIGWFPKLRYATDEQRSNWQLIGKGIGICWEDIDEDISVESLLSLQQRQNKRSESWNE